MGLLFLLVFFSSPLGFVSSRSCFVLFWFVWFGSVRFGSVRLVFDCFVGAWLVIVNRDDGGDDNDDVVDVVVDDENDNGKLTLCG